MGKQRNFVHTFQKNRICANWEFQLDVKPKDVDREGNPDTAGIVSVFSSLQSFFAVTT